MFFKDPFYFSNTNEIFTEAVTWYLGLFLNNPGWDFPGGLVVKNLSANAGVMGTPAPGRSPCQGATKPVCFYYWRLCAYSLCSVTREATAMRSPCTPMKSSPCPPQLEKMCVQQQRPSTAKNKTKKQSRLEREYRCCNTVHRTITAIVTW